MDKLIKALPAILRASGASAEVVETACIAAWKTAVGEGLSSHAVPVSFQEHKLTVVVADNIWQKQLVQMRGQLIFRLNAVLGQPFVKTMELQINPKLLAQALHKTKQPSRPAGEQPIPVELLTAAAGIEDAHLRNAFLGAAASCVRRLENTNSEN